VFTAVLGVSAILGLILFGGSIGTFLLLSVISLGMVYEYATIVFSMPDRVEKRYMLLIIAWLTLFANFIFVQHEYEQIVASVLFLFCYFLATVRDKAEAEFSAHLRELAYAVFGLIYLVYFPSYLLKIRALPYGVQWTLLTLLIVWSEDVGAYFAGRKYGRIKLYPSVSPKKTREGAIGGLLAGVAVSVVFKLAFFQELSFAAAAIIALLVGAIAQVGDLCESLVKRAFDKKDSGSILPGHGGFLDRFDSVVFGLPVMYACIRLFS
jgi:phosphatidate cytidylyltransferase